MCNAARLAWNSRKGRTSSWITRKRRLAIYLRDEFTCAYCGKDLHGAKPTDIGLDHLIPRIDGGGNETANLVTACRPCNSARQDTPWTKYATGGAKLRIRKLIRRKLNTALAASILTGETTLTAAVEALR